MAKRRGDEFENSEVFHEIQGTLARRIKRLRSERELTQKQLAEIAGISGPHLGLIEAGVGNVSLLVLAKLAQALAVSVPDLFEGTKGARTGVESTMARLAGTVERVEKHLERRRDEFARFGDDLTEFIKLHRESLAASEVPEPAEDIVRRVRKPSKTTRDGPD
jgi:transcriptional regulator with XRE-family HTH domain